MVTTDVRGSGGIEFGGEAPVAFVHGSGQVNNDIVVEWDFDNDGDFDEPEEDITAYVVSAETRTGRDWPSQISGKASPGTLRLTVRNDDDRFSFFNTASPLNTGPFSLATGRTIRVRTLASTPVDPVLLARDKFNGDGVLGIDEVGNVWSNETANTWTRDGAGRVVSDDVNGVDTIAIVDVGTDDSFVQATVGSIDGAGILYRYTDVNNYGLLFFNVGRITHYTVAAGVSTQHEDYTVGWYFAPATIGLLVSGSNVTGYLNGVTVFTGATARASASTEVGIYSLAANVVVDDFRVWDTVPVPIDGVLWTGDVSSVMPETPRDHDKTAAIAAEGRLAKAATEVETASFEYGAPTGIQVGGVLAAADLLQPPGLIAEGDISTGAVSFARNQALELARQLEETELGFLHEMPEGYIGFEARSTRATDTPAAWFSDDPAAQFEFEEIRPFDWRKEIVNRALAGLAPRTPVWPVSNGNDSRSTAAGAQNDVAVTMPSTANAGDLLLVVIASTVRTAGKQWEVPHGWRQMSNEGDSLRIRVYAKVALGTEASTDVTFYDDTTPFAGGLWVAHWWRVPVGQWFGSLDGVAQAPCVASDLTIGEPVAAAHDPPPLVVPWRRDPSLFIAIRAGISSLTGGEGGTGGGPPGYLLSGLSDLNGATNAFDVSLHFADRVGSAETEDPGLFVSEDFGGYLVVCSTTIAVRGWNGDPPLGSDRQTVQVDNLPSQDRHNMVRTYPTVPELFASAADADAYADRVTAIYGNDRPIFSISFTANKTSAYRGQAWRRRVGDMIHLTADGQSGTGVDADFFIESVFHQFSQGDKLWRVTWELSPA